VLLPWPSSLSGEDIVSWRQLEEPSPAGACCKVTRFDVGGTANRNRPAVSGNPITPFTELMLDGVCCVVTVADDNVIALLCTAAARPRHS
jgi:hypothetical protein